MIYKNISTICIGLLLSIAATAGANSATRSVDMATSDITLNEGEDLHILSAEDAIKTGVKVNLSHSDSRLYFDNIRPSDVMSAYSSSILVAGKPLEIDVNARIRVYLQGTEIIPHDNEYTPLECFSEKDFKGENEKYLTGYFYSQSPGKVVKKKSKKELKLDDKIHSLKLKRGYMATLATNPDGTGYSRCFIAEDEDLNLNQLPKELDGKVSFVRVFPWQKVSKKGWVGGNGQTDPPEGYLDDQADATRSTWVYSWGTSADWCRSPEAKGTPWRNQEYVMEKWGYGSDSDWQKIDNDMESTHLLSYNEPDHSEQSNISVEQAIAEWPRHLESGLRLGSPATTDFNWLYRFMEECDKRNYRVDYVAIHAYWGGSGSAVQVSSIDDWKRKLTEIHERTGRPIWITEWNNGANWTHESWPSDKAGQQEKQRKFMEEVLAMMDECDFIERYSIYNWVEEKRSLFWGSLDMTPAGEVYRDFNAGPAFSRSTEYIPTWNANLASPALTISYEGDRKFCLRWTDESSEFTEGYIIEQSIDGGGFTETGRTGDDIMEFIEEIPADLQYGSEVRYRVVSIADGERAKESNVISYGTLAEANDNVLTGRREVTKGLSPYVMPQNFANDPILILGPQTYRMKAPMLPVAQHIDNDVCSFGVRSWGYNANDTFVSLDTLSYFILPQAGTYDLGGLKAEANKIEGVTTDKIHVSFGYKFTSAPALFATVASDNGATPVIATVSNVSADGFDIKLSHEKGFNGGIEAETVDYIAIEPGLGRIGDRNLIVGIKNSIEMGTNTMSCVDVEYGSDIEKACFFCTMLTESDGLTSVVRAKSISGSKASIFRDCEFSGRETAFYTGDLAWFAISDHSQSGIDYILDNTESTLIYDPREGIVRRTDNGNLGNVRILTTSGNEVARAHSANSIDTTNLPKGIYIAVSSTCSNVIKFYK